MNKTYIRLNRIWAWKLNCQFHGKIELENFEQKFKQGTVVAHIYNLEYLKLII